MSNIYSKSLEASIGMIEKYGRTMSLVYITQSGSDYDPIIQETTVTAKVLQSIFTTNEIDGTLIKASDKKFLIAGDKEISLDMKIIDGNKKYSIVNILEVQPGSTLILSKVQARL